MLVKSQRLSLELPTWRNFSLCAGSVPPVENPPADSGTGGAGPEQQDKDKDVRDDRDPQVKIRALEEERDRHYRKARDQETELNELREFKTKTETAQLTEAQKAEAEAKKAQERTAQLEESNRRLAIHNAFLASNSVQWHDPAAALKLADLSEVKVENGEVTNPDALKAAISKLTKDSPWLVNSGEVKDDETKQDPPPKTGQPPKGDKPDPKKIDPVKLAEKYPALQGHIR